MKELHGAAELLAAWQLLHTQGVIGVYEDRGGLELQVLSTDFHLFTNSATIDKYEGQYHARHRLMPGLKILTIYRSQADIDVEWLNKPPACPTCGGECK